MAKFVQNNLTFRNNQKIIMGNTSQMEMKFDGTDLIITSSTGDLSLVPSAGDKVFIDGNFSLESGTIVNEISNDTNLADDSPTALITEHAVKTYVDTEITEVISLESVNGWEHVAQGDTTATIIFDVPQVDSLYSVVGNLVNEIDPQPSIYGHIIKEKTLTGFTVLFSGSIDSNNYYFDWILSREKLESSSSSSSRSSSSSSSSSFSQEPEELLGIGGGNNLEINSEGDGLIVDPSP